MGSDATRAKQIEMAVQHLAGTFNKDIVSIFVCNVTALDEDKRTCDCTPISGDATTSIPGVQLMAEVNDGMLLIPAINSTVIVALSTRNTAFVLMYSDLDKVKIITSTLTQFNDGSFGGLVKIISLTTKLNLLVSQLQAQLALIATGIIGAGGAYTPGTLSTFNKTDYESSRVTHGTTT